MRKWIFITYLAIFQPLGLYSISTDNNYSFSYIIDSEGILSQHTEESRNDVISGYYSFLQPDGIIRVVHYRAEPGRGFRVYIAFRKIPLDYYYGFFSFTCSQEPLKVSQGLSASNQIIAAYQHHSKRTPGDLVPKKKSGPNLK